MEKDKDSVKNLSDYYNEELDINKGEESFGHDAHGTSPLVDDCHHATNRAGMNRGIHQERAGAIPLQASVIPLLIQDPAASNPSSTVHRQGAVHKDTVSITSSPPKTTR
jgi:hypothetical protein